MTKGRSRTTSIKAYVPEETIVQRYASTHSWDKEKLAAALSQFGPLPEAGQEQLIGCLVLAFGPYQLAAKTTKRVMPGERHKQLVEIERTARKLLCLLNIDLISGARKSALPTAWLEAAGIDPRGADAITVNAELAEAHAEVAKSIVELRKLHKRTKVAADGAATQVDRRRGGIRRRPGAEGQLIRDAISIYRHMRGQHPDSGNEPGFGEPMQKFVRAVGALFGVEITDSAIEEAWRSREPNSK